MFSFKTFISISGPCDALFTSSFKISFSICFWSTSIKLKLPLSLHLLRIAIMLGWFLYFKIAFKVASLVLLTKGSSFEYLEISRFCTIFEKMLFKTSAVSIWFLQFHYFQLNEFHLCQQPVQIGEALLFFQNDLLSTTNFPFRFSYLFLIFFIGETQNFLCFV